MSGLEYTTARVCAMRSRLLPDEDIAEMIDVRDPALVVERLLAGPYGEYLAGAMTAGSTATALETGLGNSLEYDLSKIHRICGEDDRETIGILTERWDAQCIKGILRGIHRDLPPEQIRRALGPAATFGRDDLDTLCRLPDVKAVVDQLLSWSSPWGRLLKPLVAGYLRSPDLLPLEYAVDARRFREHPRLLKTTSGTMAAHILAAEAEAANVVTCLLFIDRDPKPPLLPQHGRRSRIVELLRRTTDWNEAIDHLANSDFSRVLDEALPFMTHPGRAAMFDRLIDEELLIRATRRARLDPLSIAVPYHYLLSKRNEIINIRLIASGLEKRIPKNAIRAGLIFARAN